MPKWKKISGGGGFQFTKKGQILAGSYAGVVDKTTYEGREILVHGVQQGKKLVTLWEATALQKLRLIPKGTEVRITYGGRQRSEKKGHAAFHVFDIEVPEKTKLLTKPGTPF